MASSAVGAAAHVAAQSSARPRVVRVPADPPLEASCECADFHRQKAVEFPTVQEQVIVREIPEIRVVEETQEQIVDMTRVVPQERDRQRTVEQIADAPIPRTVEGIVEVIKSVPQGRVSRRIVEQVGDVLVPQVIEDIVEVVRFTPTKSAPRSVQRNRSWISPSRRWRGKL